MRADMPHGIAGRYTLVTFWVRRRRPGRPKAKYRSLRTDVPFHVRWGCFILRAVVEPGRRIRPLELIRLDFPGGPRTRLWPVGD